jgi:hypothetical protein
MSQVWTLEVGKGVWRTRLIGHPPRIPTFRTCSGCVVQGRAANWGYEGGLREDAKHKKQPTSPLALWLLALPLLDFDPLRDLVKRLIQWLADEGVFSGC